MRSRVMNIPLLFKTVTLNGSHSPINFFSGSIDGVSIWLAHTRLSFSIVNSYVDSYRSSSSVSVCGPYEHDNGGDAINNAKLSPTTQSPVPRCSTAVDVTTNSRSFRRVGHSTVSASCADLGERSDTLVSPRISPLLWFQQCLMPTLVVTSSVRGIPNASGESVEFDLHFTFAWKWGTLTFSVGRPCS